MAKKQLATMFVLLYVLHSFAFFWTNKLFPDSLVLGTNLYSPMRALYISTTVFTLLVVGMIPVIEYFFKKMNSKLEDIHWIAAYLIINAAGIWSIARFSESFGMGISSWVVALILGTILNLTQGIFMKVVSRAKS